MRISKKNISTINGVFLDGKLSKEQKNNFLKECVSEFMSSVHQNPELAIRDMLLLYSAATVESYDKDFTQKSKSLSKIDLSGLDLSCVDLSGANLKGAWLAGAKFEGASLKEVKISDTSILSCNFTNADLSGAKLIGCKIKECGLDGANLEGADLSKASIDNSTLVGACFHHAKLNELTVNKSDISKSDFFGANLVNARFYNSNLREVGLVSQSSVANVTFFNCDFSSADISFADFRNCRLDRKKMLNQVSGEAGARFYNEYNKEIDRVDSGSSIDSSSDGKFEGLVSFRDNEKFLELSSEALDSGTLSSDSSDELSSNSSVASDGFSGSWKQRTQMLSRQLELAAQGDEDNLYVTYKGKRVDFDRDSVLHGLLIRDGSNSREDCKARY
jgi:uncharacterized protein YjbI with pentapeptide repeats